MTKFKTKHKVFAFLGAAFVLLIAMLFTACKQPASSSGGGGTTPTPPAVQKVKVTLESSIGGKVTVTPALSADGMVAEGTQLTFTATAFSGYKVTKWTLNGTDTDVTKPVYKLTVTKASKVKAVFIEDNPALITKHTVTLTAPVNGTVTSVPEIPSGNQVPKNTEITFTATAAAGYTVDTWNITGGQTISGGTPGNNEAKVKITVDTTVTVTFKLPPEEDNLIISGDWLFGVRDKTKLTGNLVLPDTIGKISDEAFKDCTGLTGITVPDSVTQIGEKVFEGCTALTTVSIGKGVTRIKRNIFTGCSNIKKITVNYKFIDPLGLPSLEEVIIGDNTKEIENRAFENCTALTTVSIGNGVTEIRYAAFKGCIGLTNLTLGNSVREIYKEGFMGCTALTNVTIPDSVVQIYQSAFKGCSSLRNVVIGSGLLSVDGEAFSGCTELISVNLPDNLTIINWEAFKDCPHLTDISIPDLVWIIGESAFENCSGLKNFTIGKGVTRIGDNAFKGCTGVEKLTINRGYASSLGFMNIKEVVLKDNVTEIGSFSGCTALKTVTIPVNVTKINRGAFAGCTNLTKAIINCKIVKPLGIPNLKEVVFGNTVEKIEEEAFKDCMGLINITIPDNVTEIGYNAFKNCTGLKNIAIGNGVTKINSRTFKDCTGLINITIPDSVTVISSSAFEGCTALKSIELPPGLTEIDTGAFKGCTALTSITIPDHVTRIVSYVFKDCVGLKSLSLGKGIEGIYPAAFEGCPNIEKLTVNCKYIPEFYIKSFKEVIIGDNVEDIGSRSFENCTDLTRVSIGNNVIYIKGAAFKGCSALTSLTIPDNVTMIDWEAFMNCSGLKTITIGKGAEINSDVFTGCTNVEKLTVSCKTFPKVKTAKLKEVFISDDVRNIDDKILDNHTAAVITFSDGVGIPSIGSYAFGNYVIPGEDTFCKKVRIPNGQRGDMIQAAVRRSGYPADRIERY